MNSGPPQRLPRFRPNQLLRRGSVLFVLVLVLARSRASPLYGSPDAPRSSSPFVRFNPPSDFSLTTNAMAEPAPMWSGPSVVTEPQPNAGPLPTPPAAPPYEPLYSDAAPLMMPTSMPTLPNLPLLPSLPSLPDLPALPALPGLAAPEEEEEVPAPMARPGGGGLAGGEYQQVVGSRNTIVINTGTAENLALTLTSPSP